MKEKTGGIARWLATIAIPFALLLGLTIAWTVMAQDTLPQASSPLVQYEIKLADSGVDRLEIELPLGLEYVGLAAGSQVGVEPEISSDGRRIIWHGPFTGAETLRFWLVPGNSADVPEILAIAGADVMAVRVEPMVTPPVKDETGSLSRVQAKTVSVTKTVTPTEIWLQDDDWWVTYEAVFTTDSPVVLERITDTLPAGFLWGGMAYGSDVIDPPFDAGDNRYVWEMVNFNDTLVMRYYVRAVKRTGDYQNAVEAVSGAVHIGPASATLQVKGQLVYLPVVLRNYTPPRPIWKVSKTANATSVKPGDPVNYTATIKNAGNLAGTVSSVADILPTGFTFLSMRPGSEVTTPPAGTTGTVTWTGPWTLAPGEDLILIYQVQSGGAGNKTNTFVAYGLSSEELGRASTTVSLGAALPFVDEFSTELPAWEPFTNWPGLSARHWAWAGDPGVWGIWNYEWDYPTEYTGYNLLIYNAPGAQSWTNYRVEARIKDVKDTGTLRSGLTGIWFRGTYVDSGIDDGKTVGGYYVYIKPPDDQVFLMRTPPDNRSFASHTVVTSYHYAPGIGRAHWYKIIVEARGANLKVWFEDDEDGVTNPTLIFNWTDPNPVWSSGTVGLATYYTSSRFDYIRVSALN